VDDETRANDQSEEPKKPYAKPKMQEVPLRPDEAVLGGCKTSTVGGPAHPTRCSFPGSCSALTS
jgi:hypothetical protein